MKIFAFIAVLVLFANIAVDARPTFSNADNQSGRDNTGVSSNGPSFSGSTGSGSMNAPFDLGEVSGTGPSGVINTFGTGFSSNGAELSAPKFGGNMGSGTLTAPFGLGSVSVSMPSGGVDLGNFGTS